MRNKHIRSLVRIPTLVIFLVLIVSYAQAQSYVYGSVNTCVGQQSVFSIDTNGSYSCYYSWSIYGASEGYHYNVISMDYGVFTVEWIRAVTGVQASGQYYGCQDSGSGSGTSAFFDVRDTVAPSVSISLYAGANPACPGTSVTLKANPVNGGSYPNYYWSINGGTEISTGSTNFYTYPSYSNGDQVRVRMNINFVEFPCATDYNPVSDPYTISRHALPTAYSVGGGGATCMWNTATVTLSGSQSGVNYQLKRGSSNVGSATGGTGSALNWPGQTADGSYTVVATNASSGCAQTMSGSTYVSFISLPTGFNISGGGAACAGQSSVTIDMDGSETGVNYQLRINGTNTGSPQSGTGGAMNWPYIATDGNYTVVAVNTSTGCSVEMSGSADVTVNPTPAQYTLSGGGTMCSSDAGLAINLNASQTWVKYQLRRDGNNVGSQVTGTGAALSWTGLATTGTYTVLATTTTSSCLNVMTGSPTITVNPVPNLFTLSGGGMIAAGTGTTLALSNSQTGINYQLKLNGTDTGSPMAGTGSALNFTNQTVAGTYTVVATNATTGCIRAQTGSPVITVDLLPIVQAGSNVSVILPSSAVMIAGSASDPDGPAPSLLWTKQSGPSVTLSNTTTATLTASRSGNQNLLSGTYVFRLTATDDDNFTSYDEVMLTVSYPANNYNYVREEVVQVSQKFTRDDISGLSVSEKTTNTTYLDGLGRPIQTVTTQGSAGPAESANDLVQPTVYDQYGREVKKYLPYISSENNGHLKSNPTHEGSTYTTSDQFRVYNTPGDKIADDTKPYAEVILENSPLNRPLKQGATGAAWQPLPDATNFSDKSIKRTYGVNQDADSVYNFIYNAATELIEIPRNYEAGQLTSITTYDENNNNEVIEYTDKEGRLICKKAQYKTSNGVKFYANTYYIFDDMGNLVVVLPPEAVKQLTQP